MPPAIASSSRPDKGMSRHARSSSTTTSNAPPAQVSNRQRRLASLFMALMASSPLPIEADAETLEAAQKDSVAPRAPFKSATQKKRVSSVRVQEVRTGRWKKFRAGFGRGKSRAKRMEEEVEMEMDGWVELRGEDERSEKYC
ncbi:hypothetical protein G6514_009272 [Epicoccum nigrum]|nr:hypothetical protein G6514_009272 [Epicoccum nigrum]